MRRNAGALRQQTGPDGMLVAPLFRFEPRFGFELLELTLPPDYERLSEAHAVGVIEHVIVLTGDMEVLADGEWLSLAVGDALRFAADRTRLRRMPCATPRRRAYQIPVAASINENAAEMC